MRKTFCSFFKSTHADEGSSFHKLDRGAFYSGDLGSSTDGSLFEQDGHQTLNGIMTATKNPSTVFKPPFGTNTEEHHSRLGEHAQCLWQFSKITDLTVKLEGNQYPCHKTVLSCYSKYFRELFLDENGAVTDVTLRLPSVTNTAFEVLLTYMYTADLNLTCQNIGEVYTAARSLGINGAFNLCTKILHGELKHDVSAVYVYVTAKKMQLEGCAVKALKKMTRRFEHIVGTPEFLDLDFFQVREYLSQDTLATRSEVIVYLSALKWLSVKYLDREEFAAELIGCVRFQMMTLNEVLACFSPPLLPGILELRKIRNDMLEAACYVSAATVNEEKRFERYSCKPRKYLLKREPIILWDPSIFDPDRYAMYIEEMAAIRIQAAYRGYKTRKSIEADKAEGILAGDQFTYSSRRSTSSVDDFDVPEDDDDATYVGSRIGHSLKNIKKSIVSFVSGGTNDEELDTNQEVESKIKKGKQIKKANKNANAEYYEENEDDADSFSGKDTSFSRSSSIDTLVGCINDIAENTEIKRYASETAVDMNSEAFQTSPRKPETIHKVSAKTEGSSSSASEDNVTPKANSGGHILVTGGFSYDDVEDDANGKTMFIYNASKNRWKKYGTMEKARQHHCLVRLDDAVYFIGGCDPDKSKSGNIIPDKKCYKLELRSKEWSKISKMNHSRMHHGVAEIDGKIYVVGGRDDKNRLLSSMEVYDPDTDTWKELDTSLETAMMGSGVCAHQHKIWIVGGMAEEKDGTARLLDDVKRYDPYNSRWYHNIQELPSPRAFSTAVSFKDEIYVIGGIYQDSQGHKSITDVLIYKEKEKRWRFLAKTLPSPKHLVTANVIGSNLYILGGVTSYKKDVSNEVIVYEGNTGKWFACSYLPKCLLGFASVSIVEDSPQ